MKIVKKLKGIISWHFYNDDEIKSIIETVLALLDNKEAESIPVLTNLFKGSDGDEIGEFYIITGQEENRLYIDNEQKKLIKTNMYIPLYLKDGIFRKEVLSPIKNFNVKNSNLFFLE